MLEIRQVFKQYNGKPLLQGVSFQVAEGETVCLLGPSGSGKSTLLRIITGLELPDNGIVLWNGEDLAKVPVHRRQFGLMFQDYALFPHRNVADNVAFGLHMQNLPPAEIITRVEDALQRVNMTAFSRRRVTELSGGEQQRVALARALAPNPRLLMLDEPLGALDRTLREQLLVELRHLLHTAHIPAIYVTHDQEEAFALGDRLILLNEGRVIQDASPAQVYERPASPWVARFLGMDNIITGTVHSEEPLTIQTSIGKFNSSTQVCKELHKGDNVTLLFRPTGAGIISQPGLNNNLSGEVVEFYYRGDTYLTEVQCQGISLRFLLDRSLKPSTKVNLHLNPNSIICLG
jgi:spermidine/putrescine transport system ATP-binding protein